MNLLFFLGMIFGKGIPAAVGIDLGTTFCCVGILRENEKDVTFLQFNGKYVYPSVCYYNRAQGKAFYTTGWTAMIQQESNPNAGRYFYSYKRVIGLADDSESSLTARFKKSVSYDVTRIYEGGKNKIVFKVDDVEATEPVYTDAEILTSEVLKDIRTEIENVYEIKSLVITTPAYFSPYQIESTRAAAIRASLPEFENVKEPVAAAIAYQIKKNIKQDTSDEKLLVYDLGGGTFDLSALESVDGVLDVVKHGGNHYLGGEDVNTNLYNYFSNVLLKEKNADVQKNKNLEGRLRRFVENFKIDLCTNFVKSNVLEHTEKFNYKDMETIDLSMTMDKFNELNENIYKQINDSFNDSYFGMFRTNDEGGKDTPIDRNTIGKILLVGGSSQIPYTKTILKNNFPKAKIYDELDVDKIVAEGAAYKAASKLNWLPEDLSIIVLEVAPLDIGVRVDNDFMQPILTKDTMIPGEGSMDFTTAQDNQSKVKISIAQGFRTRFSDNHFLGSCELDVAPGQPRGVPQITITIFMKADGTIEVTAKDKGTGKQSGIKFNSSVARLDAKKCAELRADAEKNKEADKELKERYVLQREFEEEIRSVQMQINQPGISEDDKINIEGIVNGVKKWLDDNKNTATKMDLEDKFARFKESIKAIRDKKDEQVEEKKEEQVDDRKPAEEKTVGRDEL